jgi:hypothetical protein
MEIDELEQIAVLLKEPLCEEEMEEIITRLDLEGSGSVEVRMVVGIGEPASVPLFLFCVFCVLFPVQ